MQNEMSDPARFQKKSVSAQIQKEMSNDKRFTARDIKRGQILFAVFQWLDMPDKLMERIINFIPVDITAYHRFSKTCDILRIFRSSHSVKSALNRPNFDGAAPWITCQNP